MKSNEKSMRDMIKSQKEMPGVLPKEIVTRITIRKIFWLLVLSWLIYNRFVEFSLFTEFAGLSTPFFTLFVEYMLCTTSLPPGEKERQKQEKEMKNLAPAQG